MHDRGFPEQQRASNSTRLRLVELSFGAGPTLDFGGRHAVVETDDANRSTVAEAIARAVIGPRSAAIDGTVEIAGRLVVLQSLPAPLLRPDAPAVVDRATLDALWQDLSVHRRGELEAAHAARRFDGHRIDAAIDRARDRIRRATPVAPAPVPEPPAPEPVVVIDDTARREAERVREQLTSLLAKYDTLTPVPSPHALALAAEFDGLTPAAPAAPDASDASEVDRAEVAAAERRVALARAAVQTTRGGIAPDARARVESAHRAVVEAERAVHEASRKQRAPAEARYEAAVAEERNALSAAGVQSYASFLMGIIASALPPDGEAAERAARELDDAEAALAAAKGAVSKAAAVPDDAPFDVDLRARAAHILGHFPGDDPSTELRAVRVEDPLAPTLRDAMASALADAGLEAGSDVVAAARAELQRPLPPVEERLETPPQPDFVPSPAVPVVQPGPAEASNEASAELDALLHDRETITRMITELEEQLDAFDRQRGLSLAAVDGVGVGAVLEALFERYRSAQLLAGRLPLVVDGALDELTPAAAIGIAGALATTEDVQVVVVTADDRLASALATGGAVRIRWPSTGAPTAEPAAVVEPDVLTEPEPGPEARPEPVVQVEPAPAPRPLVDVQIETPTRSGDPFAGITEATSAMCARHGDVAEAARCAQCGRSCCIDCLVYTTADNAVWCVDCAETLQARNLRLLRRRGA